MPRKNTNKAHTPAPAPVENPVVSEVTPIEPQAIPEVVRAEAPEAAPSEPVANVAQLPDPVAPVFAETQVHITIGGSIRKDS